MPVFKKKGRKNWTVRISQDGKPREWIIEGTRAEAKAFEARKRVEIELLGQQTRIVPTLSNFCAGTYKLYAETRLKKRTWTNRQYTIATLAGKMGHLKLTEITRQAVERYQNDRLAENIRPSTINDEMKILRRVLSYAKEIGVPAAQWTLPDLAVRGIKRRAKAWTADEVTSLLSCVASESPSIYGLVMWLLHTGCRKGEAIAAEWSWVNIKRGVIRIEPNEEWQPKNGEAREIPLEAPLLPFLEDRKHQRYVFPSEDGDRFSFWPQRAFDRARKKAGLTGGPHTTRHTYASHFLAARPNLYLLARVLGHGDITVTKLYSHLLPEAIEQARGTVSFVSPVGPAEIEAKIRWGGK